MIIYTKMMKQLNRDEYWIVHVSRHGFHILHGKYLLTEKNRYIGHIFFLQWKFDWKKQQHIFRIMPRMTKTERTRAISMLEAGYSLGYVLCAAEDK